MIIGLTAPLLLRQGRDAPNT